ncbi:MAG: glutamate 5-kinase, partial [Actinobacteria bacterium]|nr:glutamate 5-kinase [Actinomycetota bacterium]
MGNRKKYLKNIKKMVIKIGSSSLTSKAGGLDKVSMKRFVNEVSSRIKRGMEVIIVTSG